MSLRTAERINWFLNGYERIRSTRRILKMADERNWKFKNFQLEEEDG
jgi:hypothetical protein